jgi:hypothetical protein
LAVAVDDFSRKRLNSNRVPLALLCKLNDLLGDDLCCEVGPIRQRNMRKAFVEGTVSQFDCGD